MDIVNVVLTFGPAALVVYSIGKRVIRAHRARPVLPAELPARERPPLPVHRYFAVRPRLEVVRASAELVRESLEPVEPVAVRAHQNQVEPVELPEIEPVRETLQLNRLSREAEIALLAVQRNENGSYRHSANDITKFVGGTAADVKDLIAEIRGTRTPKQPPAAQVTRPPKGWANSAA